MKIPSYLPLLFIGMFFVACSDEDTPTVTKTIDTNSQEVISRVYALAKECWENPNKIADIDAVIKEGESYETRITKEIKTFTTPQGDDNATVVGAQYDFYDTHHLLKTPASNSIVTVKMHPYQHDKTSVIIYSVVKSAREDVLYWLKNDRCR